MESLQSTLMTYLNQVPDFRQPAGNALPGLIC